MASSHAAKTVDDTAEEVTEAVFAAYAEPNIPPSDGATFAAYSDDETPPSRAIDDE